MLGKGTRGTLCFKSIVIELPRPPKKQFEKQLAVTTGKRWDLRRGLRHTLYRQQQGQTQQMMSTTTTKMTPPITEPNMEEDSMNSDIGRWYSLIKDKQNE